MASQKRKNHHLLEVACSLFSNNVPKHFWGDVVLTACYLIYRMPTRILKLQTLLNIFLQTYQQTRTLNSVLLKIFGCKSFIHIHDYSHSKLDPKALKCIFLQYSSTQKESNATPWKNTNIILLWMSLFFFF